MALQVGIVGLPNVGKSTLFNALTSAKAEAANYPFCTIDPNVGIVTVPDPRLDQIGNIFKSQKVIPSTVEFVDIAGLVKGASQGEGLGNQFLSHIRQTNSIVHVVRCFEDDNVIHVNGSVDPIRDIEVINTELLLADLDSMEKRYTKIEKIARTSTDVKIKEEYELTKKVYDWASSGKSSSELALSDTDKLLLKEFHLLTAKPVLYVCNVSEEDYANSKNNRFIEAVTIKAKKENNEVIIISSALESEISQLPMDDRKEFLDSMNITEPGLNRLILSAYKLLDLQTFFTAGEKEVRAWTIKKGTKAPQAAGEIHSDFERGFIRAEAYHCDDLFKHKSEANLRELGKYKSEGKDYIVKDGDVLFFKFNV